MASIPIADASPSTDDDSGAAVLARSSSSGPTPGNWTYSPATDSPGAAHLGSRRSGPAGGHR